ncbi:MAG: hypothetical protein ACYDB4_17810 [Candidatus Dormibacteraceae bacterium]
MNSFPTDPVQLGHPAGTQVPDTRCGMGIDTINGHNPNAYFDVSTGGYKGTGPLSVTWHAYFQGGFNGAIPTFTWSDGHLGTTSTVTYTKPGTYGMRCTAKQVRDGVTYAVDSRGAGIPITVTGGS